MTRQESDREDIFREATALVERAELRPIGSSQLITAGFRKDGAFSIFLDQDPVYQFDSRARLRRAFVQGFLYRSQHTTLARLRRERTEHQTLLQRTDLSPEELQQFRLQMLEVLREIHRALIASQVECHRCMPSDFDAATRIAEFLSNVLRMEHDWLSTNIPARR